MVFASAQGIMTNFNQYIGNAARRRRLSADRKKKVYRNALGSNSNSSVGSVASNVSIPMNSRSRGRGRTRSRGRGRGRSRSRTRGRTRAVSASVRQKKTKRNKNRRAKSS